jgi:IS1 family transposase
MNAYADAVERGFGCEVGYGQIEKTYSVSNLNKEAAARYSPCDVIKVDKTVVNGMPDVSRITTSHVEKQNHTLRMHNRRLTRLTNAFSKKFENFEAAVALNFVYYNFCKTHGAIRMTPCQAAGIESSAWTVAELLERCGE